MSKVTFDDILKDIKARKFASVYALQGEETFFTERIVEALDEHVLNPAEKSFNMTTLYGKETNMGMLLSQARRFPMMAEYQLVILKEAQSMLDLGRAEPQEELIKYLENPVPSTVLVICYMGKKMDGRLGVTKKLGKVGILHTGEKIKDYQVPQWITNFVKAKGYQMTNKATLMMSEFIGNNLDRIYNELNKILMNMQPGHKEINEEIVERMVGISKEFNTFELQTAILNRDLSKVSLILNYFEANEKNNPAPVVIYHLTTLLQNALAVSLLKDVSDQSIKSAVPGMWGSKINEYRNGRKFLNYYKCIKGIEMLHEADLKLKGVINNSMSGPEIIREFVLKLMF